MEGTAQAAQAAQNNTLVTVEIGSKARIAKVRSRFFYVYFRDHSEEGGKGYFRDSWSALFISSVMWNGSFLLVNSDFHSRCEPWFSKMFSFIFREAWNANVIFFVNCERAVLFSVKRDLYPPFTTLSEVR